MNMIHGLAGTAFLCCNSGLFNEAVNFSKNSLAAKELRAEPVCFFSAWIFFSTIGAI
jgi:hypothetical protein